jgi:hypothetical protein
MTTGRADIQIGGLSLATVAVSDIMHPRHVLQPDFLQVERALTFFKTGHDVSKVENNGDSKRTRVSGNGFTDTLWGSRARSLVDSTERLRKHHWDRIEDYASAYFPADPGRNDEDDGEDVVGAAVAEYDQIDIYWYVFLRFPSLSVNGTNVSLEYESIHSG